MVEVGDGKWKARCPVPEHGDTFGSLSVRRGKKAVLLHCFGGCSKEDVLMGLGLRMRDLFGSEEEDVVEKKPVHPVDPNEPWDDVIARLPYVTGGELLSLEQRGIDHDLACFFGYGVWSDPKGIALPSRGLDGKTKGIQVRIGKAGHKYHWVTPPCVHVSKSGNTHLQTGFRVVEGIIKADVAAYRTGYPTVAINGCSNWKALIPLVEEVQPKQVVLAFDLDWKTKAGVRKARRDLALALLARRIDVFTEEWPDQFKDIDEYLASGGPACGIERQSYNP